MGCRGSVVRRVHRGYNLAMSKHSKWAKIKHAKGAEDAKRGQVFTKLGRAIAIAARKGADPARNAALRMAIEAARAANMPKDTIDRAVARAAGGEGAVIEEVAYEGFGPGGTVLLIVGTTDNRNRTTAEIRHLLSKGGGSLGASGSTAWMFEKKGVLRVPTPAENADGFTLSLIDLGAEDVRDEDNGLTVFVPPERFDAFRADFEKQKVTVEYAEIEFVPKDRMSVAEDVRAKLDNLIEILESHDDVQSVYTNADV